MPGFLHHRGFLRDKASKDRGRVYPVELFFDLVFVFAVTQLSHLLLAKLTVQGLLETMLLLLAVWWVWMYTTWFTNWLDPDRTPVRLSLFVLMLPALVMAISIPTAFGAGGLAFAVCYAIMQVGRTAFAHWAVGEANRTNVLNFRRILVWLSLSGAFWIAGGLAEGNLRLALWTVALALEFCAPWLGYWVPGIGASATTDWDIDGHHMAERCSLFVLIALGESLIITGATFEKLPVTAATVAALVSAVAATAAMWWIYFAIGAERGTRHIAHSSDPGRIGRIGYTYLHIIIVAGVIVAAVADELVLAHPAGHVALGYLLAIVGAPILFLTGNACFKRLSAPYFPLSHLVGLGALAVIGLAEFALHLFSPLALSLVTTAILIGVAIWEWMSLGGYRHAADDAEMHPG
jgi:low temperature requirement protein LtrA